MDKVFVNAVPIDNVSMEEALDRIEDAVRSDIPRCVFFVNADCLNISARDPEYHRILERDDAWVFADGIGVAIAGRVSRQPLLDNVNGTDLFPLLCERASHRGLRLFLLGAQSGVAEQVAGRMAAQYPGLQIVGTRDGYFSPSQNDAVIEQINASDADVLLVALGAPRQEKWIAAHRARLRPPVLAGVGGLFDFYSGRVRRAPRIVRAVKLEWAWRLAMEPRRLWRRYLVGNPVFMTRLAWWELRGRNRPPAPRS